MAARGTHAYRFVAEVLDDNRAQGLRTTQRFIWQARPTARR